MRIRVCIHVRAYACVRAREITSNRTALAPPPRTFPAQSPAPPGSPLLKPFPGQKSRFCEKVISRIAQKASRSLSVAFLASRRVKIWVDAPRAKNGLLARLRGHGAGAGCCSQVSLPSARGKTLCRHRFRGLLPFCQCRLASRQKGRRAKSGLTAVLPRRSPRCTPRPAPHPLALNTNSRRS